MTDRYAFESANKGVVEIEVTGRYTDGTCDVDVCYADGSTSFEEIDGGSADDVVQWLLDEGVRFESRHNAAFVLSYVASVLLDGDVTESQLIGRAAKWTDERVERILSFIDFPADQPRDLSVSQAAKALGVTRARVHQLIQGGKLAARKVGSYYVVDGDSVDARIAALAAAKAVARDRWRENGHGEYIRDDGSYMIYGEFGRDTYGLHVAGSDYCYKVYSSLSRDVPAGYDKFEDAERIILEVGE